MTYYEIENELEAILKSFPKDRQPTCLSYWNSGSDYKEKLAATVKLCGKSDLFSVVIALRYLLPRKSFLVFKKALVQEIGRTVKNASTLTEDKLLSAMGFPENWRDITRYKM